MFDRLPGSCSASSRPFCNFTVRVAKSSTTSTSTWGSLRSRLTPCLRSPFPSESYCRLYSCCCPIHWNYLSSNRRGLPAPWASPCYSDYRITAGVNDLTIVLYSISVPVVSYNYSTKTRRRHSCIAAVLRSWTPQSCHSWNTHSEWSQGPRRNCLGRSRPFHLIGAFSADQFAVREQRARNLRSCLPQNYWDCCLMSLVFWLIAARREAADQPAASDCNADASLCHDLRCRCWAPFDSGKVRLAGGWRRTVDADYLIGAKMAALPRMLGPPRRTL